MACDKQEQDSRTVFKSLYMPSPLDVGFGLHAALGVVSEKR